MTGKVGKALGFDGSDSYINSGIDESLQIQDEITISAWIKIKGDSGGSYSGIVSNTPASSQFNYLLGIKDQNDNPVASFQHSSVERLAHSQSLERNKWYFLTMVVDSSHIHLYVNGSNPESISKGSTNYTWNDTIIGTFRTNYFNGIIDQVRIYDYARTPAQIAWDYNRGAPVGHWKFDECQGTTAHDASGNENHGTINIGATGSQTSAGTCASGNSAHAWYNGREGRINSAMSFDGADDYVDLGVETFSYINNRNPVSVLAWVNTTNREQSFAGIFSKSQGGSTTAVRFDLHYYFAGEVLHLRQSIGDGSSTTSLARDINWVNNNEWHLVGMTWNGESMKLFLDGKQLGNSATINLDIGLSTASWKIGRAFNSSSYSFPGLIDDVRIYNYALTEYQIKLLHNEGAAVRFSNQFPFP
jgi:hypothetical protein